MQISKEQKIRYLNRRIDEIKELKEYLKTSDFESTIMIGHRLKGNGATFGFPLISKIGISLEEAARSKDISKIQESIENLSMSIEENLKNFQ